MNDILYEDIDLIVEEIKQTKEYQRLLELNQIIKKKYISEIDRFNLAKEKVANMNKYYPDYKEAQQELLEAKEVLYHFSEVAEYKRLETKISEMLENISKKVKEIL